MVIPDTKSVLAALESIKIPDLKKRKFSAEAMRANRLIEHLRRPGLTTGPRRSAVFGLTISPGSAQPWKPMPSSMSRRHPDVHRLLFAYVKGHAPKGFTFDCVTVNHNVKCSKHVDTRNIVSGSLITSMGQYTGGELCMKSPVTGKVQCFDTRRGWLLYNGARWPHWNRPIRGTKYSVVAYNRHGHRSKPTGTPVADFEPTWVSLR